MEHGKRKQPIQMVDIGAETLEIALQTVQQLCCEGWNITGLGCPDWGMG